MCLIVVVGIRVFHGGKSVADRLEQYGPAARGRLAPAFEAAGVEYPPKCITLVGLKTERQLQVYAGTSRKNLRFVKAYPILGMSGRLGPKLREGDLQVPEGIYTITFLNPNSAYHLSLRIGYPNRFDRAMAKKDGGKKLGGNIMIHGGRASIGCLAMGDPASEDLFVLAADTGIENMQVILSPLDFRNTHVRPDARSMPRWTGRLYGQIAGELGRLPVAD